MTRRTVYEGPERRRHRMYLTRNTEYHFRDDVCIAVKDRRTGSWLVSHLALQRRLGGSVRFLKNGAAIPSDESPQVGEALYFGLGGQELVTSALCGIGRPQRPIVESYPSLE